MCRIKYPFRHDLVYSINRYSSYCNKERVPFGIDACRCAEKPLACLVVLNRGRNLTLPPLCTQSYRCTKSHTRTSRRTGVVSFLRDRDGRGSHRLVCRAVVRLIVLGEHRQPAPFISPDTTIQNRNKFKVRAIKYIMEFNEVRGLWCATRPCMP